MQILRSSGGIASTNCYLVGDEETGQAVLFDAPNDTTAPLLEEAEKRKWEIIGLWLTHGHFDHTADHAVVTSKFPGAKVLIHELDEPKLIDPTSRFFQLPFVIPPRRADAYVKDDEELSIGGLRVRAIHTPGHSPGHVMFHFPDQHVLIGGDLIIMGAVGRTDLPDSNEAALMASIRKIMKLPGETRLLAGHGQASTLAQEAQSNPFVIEAMRG
ncbi:MAG: MBL fold metallo-hydrolase [Tepidisphaeraceae bacterium]|jgi:glyoxylase-like metal-dependent hydrolase (beta-lactamase superfamily II)